MTIKQNGGVFGRNPTFNNVTIDGDLTVEGAVVHDGDLTVDNINLSGNTISTTNTNGDLLLDPNGTGKVGVNELSPDRTFSVTAAAVIPVRFESTGRDNQLEFANSVGTPKIGSFDDNFLILTGGSETVRVDSSGHLIVPAGITLGTATGSYVAANTIDDYEEGTWTANLTMTSGSVGYGSQLGKYVKVGNQVTANAWIAINSVSSPAGALSVALPFAIASTATRPASYVMNFNLTGVTGQTQGWVNPNTANLLLTRNDNGAGSSLDGANLQVGSELYISITYIV